MLSQKKLVSQDTYRFSSIAPQRNASGHVKTSLSFVNSLELNSFENNNFRVHPNIGISQSMEESMDTLKESGMSLSSGIVVANYAPVTEGFVAQFTKYNTTMLSEQRRLNLSNAEYLKKIYSSEQPISAKVLRNKSDWVSVKRMVVRDELMNLQMAGKCELNLTEEQLKNIKTKIKDLDLSNLTDKEITQVIDEILKPSDADIILALKRLNSDNIASDIFQCDKIAQLKEYLEQNNIDPSKITHNQLKEIKNKFIERTEIHHRTSISADATKQNDIDNLDALNRSDHKAKHTDANTKKLDYKKPLYEKSRNRESVRRKNNTKRVVKNELAGLGIAVLIGAGIGFTLGFVTTLAQNGLNPSSLKYAFASGTKGAAKSIPSSLVTYGIGRTVGRLAANKLSEAIINRVGTDIASETAKRISTMCSTGVVGSLTIIVFSVYQFAKLKKAGYSTKEAMLRVGKSAAISFSILIITIIVQGLWGGPIGIAVSVTIGIVMTGTSVCKIVHDKKIREKIALHFIKLTEPNFVNSFA